jgi:hypothetical protein
MLVTGALAACGGSEDTAAPPATTTATTDGGTTATEPADTETEPAGTETEPAETETEPGHTETEPPATTSGREPDVQARIAVVEGERARGPGTVEAKQGDRVRIVIAVDEPQEFHLHGYELSAEATPGTPAIFAFRAELEGLFELESHASDEVIVNVAVEP